MEPILVRFDEDRNMDYYLTNCLDLDGDTLAPPEYRLDIYRTELNLLIVFQLIRAESRAQFRPVSPNAPGQTGRVPY